MDLWEGRGLDLICIRAYIPCLCRSKRKTRPGNRDVLPLWELDDGIIEGALMARYPEEGDVEIKKIPGNGDLDDIWQYHLLIKE